MTTRPYTCPNCQTEIDIHGALKLLISIGILFGIGFILAFVADENFKLIIISAILLVASSAILFFAPLNKIEKALQNTRKIIESFIAVVIIIGIILMVFNSLWQR